MESIASSTGCKEDIRHKLITKKQNIVPQNKKIVKNKLRLGKGIAGIICKKNPTG